MAANPKTTFKEERILVAMKQLKAEDVEKRHETNATKETRE
jgi:hypothetical protein